MTRLLIGYDGTDTARAAIAAAGNLFPGAEAVVASVHPRPPSPEAGALARIVLPDTMIREGIQRIREQAQEHANAMAQNGRALAQAAGLQATAEVLIGLSAWRELRAAADSANVDVVVCGTANRTAVERVVLGSTASSLVHHAAHPLLVVPAETPLAGPWIAGYDGSDGAREALRFMADHLRDRPVVVTHAWRSPLRHTLRGEALTRSKIDTFMDYVETVDTIWADVAQETADEGAEYARSLGMTAQRGHSRVGAR